MKITIQRTESKEIEIITPAYFRIGKNEVVAIFDEKNIMTAYHSSGMTTVRSRDIEFFHDKDQLKDENIITEIEFFECYNKAHAALSLLPKYSESDEHENGFTSREDDEKSVNDHYETELHNYGN